MRSAYIQFIDGIPNRTTRVGQTRIPIHALPPLAGSDVPTVGEIKRALHDLLHNTSGAAQNDAGAMLREAHDLLRRLANRNGVDPDAAVQHRRAAIQSQREQLILASAPASNQTSG
jgi:hypothetical protein